MAILQERLGKEIDEKTSLSEELVKIRSELQEQKENEKQEIAFE